MSRIKVYFVGKKYIIHKIPVPIALKLKIRLVALGLFKAGDSVDGKEEANMATSVQNEQFYS